MSKFATTRWITGGSYRHGYVYDGNRVVVQCKHKHRSTRTAQSCADRMLRDLGRPRAAQRCINCNAIVDRLHVRCPECGSDALTEARVPKEQLP